MNNQIPHSLKSDISSIRRELSKDFRIFRKLYFAHYHKVPDASFHHDICQILSDMTFKRGAKVALAAPRGSAKSTIITLQYSLYCVCHKIEPFILVMASTNDQVENYLRDIKRELESNPLLIQDFPDVCEIGAKPGPPRWTKDQIITRNGVNVQVLSVNQQVRGRKYGEFRPSLILLDDIESDDSLRNPDNFYKLQDRVTKSIIYSGTSATNVVYAGTIHHHASLLAQFTSTDQFPGWIKRIYRSVISWSEHPELWEQWVKIYHRQEQHNGKDGPEAAKEYFEENREAMLQGTQVLWPENKDFYSLMVEREQLGSISFDSEMQNQALNPRDCFFNLSELHYWDDEYRSEDELLSTIDKHMLLFGSCDPSLGRLNKHADYSAILSAALDTEKNVIYILDCDVGRKKPDRIISDIIAYHARRKYQKFAFESNQFQEYMATILEQKARETGEHLNVEQVKHLTNKQARIETLQPLVKNGTIRFSKKHLMLLEQMKFYPKGGFDDAVDGLEMLISIAKKPLTITVKILGEDRDNDWYSDYQKNFGWPPIC